MKDVFKEATVDILLSADEHTSWNRFVEEVTNSDELGLLMNKGLNVYFEWAGQFYHVNGKTQLQLKKELENWVNSISTW